MPGYAVVDVETTGLRPSSDRVVQVAITQLSPDGVLESAWSSLVNPLRAPGPVHVHQLTAQDLAQAPTYAQLIAQIDTLLADRVFVAHNVDFDWCFLVAEHRRNGSRLPVRMRLCTMDLTRALRLPVPDVKLASLASHWQVPQLRAHDAADDTRVLADVFTHTLALANDRGTPLPLLACTGWAGRRVWWSRHGPGAHIRRARWKARRRWRRWRRTQGSAQVARQ